MANDRTLELKIAKVDEKGWDYMLRPVSEAQAAVQVDAAYVKKHAPQPGGTYIRFANGSEGYAPPGATELPVLAGTTVDDAAGVPAGTELFVPAGEPIPGEEDLREP